MAVYKRGAKGPEVSKIRAHLKELGYYRGPIDVIERAVVASFLGARGRGLFELDPFSEESAWYDVAQICMEGHLTNSATKRFPDHCVPGPSASLSKAVRSGRRA